jgi:hypothetical protein
MRIRPQSQLGGGVAEHRLHPLDRSTSLECPACEGVACTVEVEGANLVSFRTEPVERPGEISLVPTLSRRREEDLAGLVPRVQIIPELVKRFS